MELQDAANRILYEGHPSIGTKRAVFLFALGQGPTRFLSVETNNPWAVLCMERLLLVDGKASDACQVLQVIRDHRNTGVRHSMTEEIPFVDFMLDIVDMDRLLGGDQDDVIVLETFKNSLSAEENKRAIQKLQAIQNAPKRDIFAGYEAPQVPAPVSSGLTLIKTSVPQEDQTEKLTAALVGLGFKKSDVRQYVNKLGSQVHTEKLQDLVRQGLRALAA